MVDMNVLFSVSEMSAIYFVVFGSRVCSHHHEILREGLEIVWNLKSVLDMFCLLFKFCS